MNHKPVKKLRLSVTTVKPLTDADLRGVAGGRIPATLRGTDCTDCHGTIWDETCRPPCSDDTKTQATWLCPVYTNDCLPTFMSCPAP